MGASSYNYGWDKNSNRTSDEAGLHSYNDGDQLIDSGFVYDADGNQTASTAYPNASYNGIDQTISITKAGQAAVPFGYAGMGQSERISAGATTTKNGVLGKQIETTGGQSTAYVHDAYGGLVYQDGPGGDDYYYYFDGLGSVIGMTDTAGNQRTKYSYDPFGAHATETAVNGSLPANPWRWMGGYLDATTGLYHFGERYYDPTLGRFLQVDPVAGGSCNAYDYSCGDPINYSDTGGTWTVAIGNYVLSGGSCAQGSPISFYRKGDNTRENRIFADAVLSCETQIGRKLTAAEKTRLHHLITGQGLGYHEIVAECVDLFGGTKMPWERPKKGASLV